MDSANIIYKREPVFKKNIRVYSLCFIFLFAKKITYLLLVFLVNKDGIHFLVILSRSKMQCLYYGKC